MGKGKIRKIKQLKMKRDKWDKSILRSERKLIELDKNSKRTTKKSQICERSKLKEKTRKKGTPLSSPHTYQAMDMLSFIGRKSSQIFYAKCRHWDGGFKQTPGLNAYTWKVHIRGLASHHRGPQKAVCSPQSLQLSCVCFSFSHFGREPWNEAFL